MSNAPITEEQLLKELTKNISEMTKELNKDKDVMIKRKAAGKIQLIWQLQKNMN